jgi:hypothetical protein
MSPNSSRGGSMSIDISAVKTIGSGILRPEGVMVELKIFLEDPQSFVNPERGFFTTLSKVGLGAAE